MTPHGLLPNIINVIILEGSMTLHNGGKFPDEELKLNPLPEYLYHLSGNK
jgi:hypothetical protein